MDDDCLQSGQEPYVRRPWKETAAKALPFLLPSALLLMVVVLLSFSGDPVVRILWPDLLMFAGIGAVSAVVALWLAVGCLRRLRVAFRDNLPFSRGLLIRLGVTLLLLPLAVVSFLRAGDSLLDLLAPETYLTGTVERYTPHNDGTGPFIKLEGDHVYYGLEPPDADVGTGHEYTFRHFPHRNIVFLTEDSSDE